MCHAIVATYHRCAGDVSEGGAGLVLLRLNNEHVCLESAHVHTRILAQCQVEWLNHGLSTGYCRENEHHSQT